MSQPLTIRSRQEKRWLRHLLPKEHGAWAMWLIPFVIATVAVGRVTAHTLLMFDAVLLVFIARTAFSSAIRVQRQDRSIAVKCALAGLSLILVAALCLIPVVMKTDWTLWAIVVIAALLFSLDLVWIRQRTEHGLFSELAGVAGFALSAPAALVATVGAWRPQAFVLWLVCFGFFAGSVFYVKLRVARITGGKNADKSRRIRYYARLNLSYAFAALGLALLLALTGWTSGWLIFAFVPWIVHILWVVSQRTSQRNIHRVGWSLVAHSLYFATSVSIIFAFA